MNKFTRKKIENYLYNYNYINTKIKILVSAKKDYEYKQNYTRYIKNKSSSLEEQAIRNINIEKRILKLKKWQNLIKDILCEYRKTDKLKYYFIFFKYFKKKEPIIIEKKLNINTKKQKDIRNEILQYIFFVAIKRNILKEVD